MSCRPRRALKKRGHVTGHGLWESKMTKDSSVPLDGVMSICAGMFGRGGQWNRCLMTHG